MEKDYAIDRVRWYTFEPREDVIQRFRVIIDFVQDNNLTRQTICAHDEKITDETKIITSDLTEEGMKMMVKCHSKWLRIIGRGKKNIADMKMWHKALIELRSENN